MAKLDEKNVASVKKTVSVAAPTGPLFSAFDIAQSKKIAQNLGGKKAANEQANALVGINRTAATPAKGKGGQTMGGKATAAKGKGGPTMGQKAAVARGQGGPVAQAIANKLTGKPAAAVAAPAVKKEELKMSTYELPDVFEVAGHTYNFDDVIDAVKKTENTYGKSSRQYRALVSALGNQSSERLAFTALDFKKPDLRKDAGKSYVDTAQTVFGAHSFPRFKETGSDYGHTDDQIAISLLNQFGVKGARNLSKDERAVNARK